MDKLHELEQSLEEARCALKAAEQRDEIRRAQMRLLFEAGNALADSADVEVSLRQIAKLAVTTIADWCTVTIVDDTGVVKRVAAVHKDQRLDAIARDYESKYPPTDHRNSNLLDVLRTGKAFVRERLDDAALREAAQNAAHLALMRTLGCSACIIAPMVTRGEVVGVLSLMQSSPDRQFDADDVTLAEELARRAAIAIENSRLQKRAARTEQERRRQAEQRFELLVESIRDYAVFMLDVSGRVVTWNPGAARIKGYTAADILGHHFSEFYPADDVASGKCEYELDVASRTGRFEEEGWRVRKDGTRFWANVILSAMRDENGKLIGFAKVTRDLTERAQAEYERNAREAAEQANRAKDEFLAMLGHELRNPLAPIVTAIQLMKMHSTAPLSKEQRIIERQVQHMVRLVDDLLDASRISQGKVELKRETFELSDVVSHAVDAASPLLDQKRHHFTADVPREGFRLRADRVRIQQILSNLITNAAKYTDPGGHIAVRAWHEDGNIALEVSDDGVGIAPELLPRIFELFVQGARGAERAEGGLGIGLTLVRQLVLLHGGTVEARSEGPKRGSTFTVRLPAASSRVSDDSAAVVLTAMPAATGRRILIVDDNVDAAELLQQLLDARGYQTMIAHDCAQALDLLARFTPEVALLDIGLPIMDGYELAAAFRARLGDACQLIAITGYGQEHDLQRSREAHFAEHLVKPVDTGRLLALLATRR